MSSSMLRWHTLLLLSAALAVPALALAAPGKSAKAAKPAAAAPAAPAAPATPTDSAPPGPDAESRKEEAKQRFQRGLELVQNESWDAALAEFLASRKLFPTRVALKNAALSLRQLKRYVEALAMYNELLASFGTSIPAEERKTIDDAVGQLQKNVGEILVESNQPGSNVVIDGQQQPGATPLPAIGVNAGTHTVRVSKEGFDAYEKQVLVAGGQRESVSAKLRALSQIGKLVVQEAGGQALDVVVDGAVVGKTPRYEGVVSVGPHTVFLRGEGNLGTPPSAATVRENQATSLSLSAVELDADVRIEPVPSNARVFVDGVQLGTGVWEGRLQSGAHQVEIAADGFLAYRKAASLTKGKHELLKVLLERDLSNPMWQAGFVPHLYLEVFGGGLLALGGLGGGADDACSSGKCQDRSLPLGFAAGARLGYQFAHRLSAELGFGFLYVSEKMTRTIDAGGENGVVFHSTDYKDQTTLAAPFLVVSGAYQLLDKTPLTFRLGAGAARARATFKNGGTFLGDITNPCDATLPGCDATETAQVSQRVVVPEEPATVWVPFAAPEVRIGYRVSKKLVLDFGVALYIMLPPSTVRTGKATGDDFSNLNRGQGQRRAALDDIPDAFTSPASNGRPGIISLERENGLGVILAIMPTFAGHFDF